MSRIDNLDSRLGILESQSGVVVLEDGSRFIPSSGLKLMRHALRFERDNGRKPTLADLPEDDRAQIIGFSRWKPDLHRGQLAQMAADMARDIVERG